MSRNEEHIQVVLGTQSSAKMMNYLIPQHMKGTNMQDSLIFIQHDLYSPL